MQCTTSRLVSSFFLPVLRRLGINTRNSWDRTMGSS